MSQTHVDCIIVGAGVIGMMLARTLRQKSVTVRLFDQREAGRESSWAGGGILSPLYAWRHPEAVNRLAHWSQAVYPELTHSLHHETGIDPEHLDCGMLVTDAEQDGSVERWATEFGQRIDWISTEEAEGIARGIAYREAALWIPTIGQVRNPRLTRALRTSLLTTPGLLNENTLVDSLLIENDRVRGVRTATETIHAEHVILATGAWTGQFMQGAGDTLPIAPVRGQMILFKAAPGLLKPIVMNDGFYLIPRADGRILAGSTVEDAGFDTHTTDAARTELLEKAITLCPVLRDATIETQWAGLRPGSPKGVPVIAAHPSIGGLWLNAGHFRNGLTLAPASAELMANLLLGEAPILDAEPYTLDQALSS